MIIAFCGPPGAGKSNIAKGLISQLEDAHLLSSDWFKRKAYARLFQEVEKRLGRQRYLVLDATFYRKLYRDRLREIACGKDVVITVFIDCLLGTCLNRNRMRANPIPEEAVHIIWSEFERPENPDIYINTEELSIEKAVEIIINELQKYHKTT